MPAAGKQSTRLIEWGLPKGAFMPNDKQGNRKDEYRAVIEEFLLERKSARLDKLSADDPKRADLEGQFETERWLQSAARRVSQIQAVTHSLKPIHPDAKGSNLYVYPRDLPARQEVGSHVQKENFVFDVVGNAAALDVYKLLKLDLAGSSLLERLESGDADAEAALSDDAEQAAQLRKAFLGLIESRNDRASSHALAKQIYWLAGNDPTHNDQFHLLAPLYPTSLIHSIHSVIQNDRFGEENKAARKARSEKRAFDGAFRNYPGLAVQKLGGTKPQNISQLNSERGGVNYLLSCAPPSWRATKLRIPLKCASVVDSVFPFREGVRETVDALVRLLLSDPQRNMRTRNSVEQYVDSLIDELVQMARLFQQSLEPRWSLKDGCELNRSEQLWLDPYLAESDDKFREDWLRMDWPVEIGHRFANWLNAQLRKHRLPVGDAEHRQWERELLSDEEADGWAQQLHSLRKNNRAPTYIAVRGGAK